MTWGCSEEVVGAKYLTDQVVSGFKDDELGRSIGRQ